MPIALNKFRMLGVKISMKHSKQTMWNTKIDLIHLEAPGAYSLEIKSIRVNIPNPWRWNKQKKIS